MDKAVLIPHPYKMKAPPWLEPSEKVLDRPGGLGAQGLFVGELMWDDSLSLYLRPDHWAAPVLRAGLEPWNFKLQGAGPPKNWKPGNKVMLRGGEISVDLRPYWVWNAQYPLGDIIGYEPSEATEPKVIQDDRDAASEIVRWGAPGLSNGNATAADEIKGGLHDNYAIVKAFARHRLAAELEEEQAEVKRLREAVDCALKCTPSIAYSMSAPKGQIVYDCGDPWEILRRALNPKEGNPDGGR
jgi:hypothetical protein